MEEMEVNPSMRYIRQTAFAPLGEAGQDALARSRAMILGAGGLGSNLASLLARAGVGTLRIVDDDVVDWTNIHRQAMYDEADAGAATPKALAAAEHIRQFNSTVTVEPVVQRARESNIAELAAGADVILDGTDNFPARYILNDYAVQHRVPWVFAGAVGCEAQTMTIVPGRTACLRCIYDSAPPDGVQPTCRTHGVLGPLVSAIASIQALEAIKILTGQIDRVSPYLLKIDLWTNEIQRFNAAQAAADGNCPCCRDARSARGG